MLDSEQNSILSLKQKWAKISVGADGITESLDIFVHTKVIITPRNRGFVSRTNVGISVCNRLRRRCICTTMWITKKKNTLQKKIIPCTGCNYLA